MTEIHQIKCMFCSSDCEVNRPWWKILLLQWISPLVVLDSSTKNLHAAVAWGPKPDVSEPSGLVWRYWCRSTPGWVYVFTTASWMQEPFKYGRTKPQLLDSWATGAFWGRIIPALSQGGWVVHPSSPNLGYVWNIASFLLHFIMPWWIVHWRV